MVNGNGSNKSRGVNLLPANYKNMKCKRCEKIKKDNQGNQYAPAAFTGNEVENIEKERINYYMRKYLPKVILWLVLVVVGLIIWLI